MPPAEQHRGTVYDTAQEVIDGTPRCVAIYGVVALAVLVALKQLGFRFAFGVGTR